MNACKRSVVALLVLGLTVMAGCAVQADEEEGEVSTEALTSGGGTTSMVFLGSSAFLQECAGNTLGCGRAVSSVSDATPYFSAPRTWSRSTCNQFFTFRVNGRCVEAQRLEVSDHRNFIEGNPGLFDALGLSHSDGTRCAGSGRARGVTVTPGRHCNEAVTCQSDTLGRAVPQGACVKSKFDGIVYQCSAGHFVEGGANGSGPAGACVTP